MKSLSAQFKLALILLLSFQMISCGTILYPDRRNQRAGHLDPGVTVLDAVCLLFGIIPGIIAFAVDFSTGAIYFPAEKGKTSRNQQNFRIVKFDPHHYTPASLEAIIHNETRKDFHFSDQRLRLITLRDQKDIPALFAQFQQQPSTQLSSAAIK